MSTARKTILFIACSIDGFIATKTHDLSFLSKVEIAGEDYGYFNFLEQIDTVIMGRKTYDYIMSMVTEFPHAELETFIITRNPKPSLGKINFYSGDFITLVKDLKSKNGKDIFIDGGAEIVNELLKHKPEY